MREAQSHFLNSDATMRDRAITDNKMNPKHILIVEDDTSIALLLSYNLSKAGFSVSTAETGNAALHKINTRRPDAIILDWMLPDISGIEISKHIRNHSTTKDIPILMLTARSQEQDVVTGFTSGVDDYVAKPFSIPTMLLRLKALLRRSSPQNTPIETLLQFHDVVLNPTEHKIQRNGRNITLGPTEFNLLTLFLRYPRKVFSRYELLDLLWGQHNLNVELRTVDVHIRRLRKQLNAPGEPDLIRTIRSAGYALDINPTE